MTAVSASRLVFAYGGVTITYPFVLSILVLIVNPSYFFAPVSGGDWQLMFFSLILAWLQGGFVALGWILVNGILLEFIRSRLDVNAIVFVLIGAVLTAVTVAIAIRQILWSPEGNDSEYLWGFFVAQGLLSGAIGTTCLHLAPEARETSG